MDNNTTKWTANGGWYDGSAAASQFPINTTITIWPYRQEYEISTPPKEKPMYRIRKKSYIVATREGIVSVEDTLAFAKDEAKRIAREDEKEAFVFAFKYRAAPKADVEEEDAA